MVDLLAYYLIKKRIIIDFGTSIKTCLKDKYVSFSGRASRSEYWYFVLFTFICNLIASAGNIISPSLGTYCSYVLSIIFFLPQLGVSVRRLHDINRSGWYYLLALIPILGWIVLLIFFCLKSNEGPNRFGESPFSLKKIS